MTWLISELGQQSIFHIWLRAYEYTLQICAPLIRSLRRGADLGAFGPDRAELEFGDLAERIERRVGQQIGGGFRVAERHGHPALRDVAIGAHLHLDRAAAGFPPGEIPRPHLHPPPPL